MVSKKKRKKRANDRKWKKAGWIKERLEEGKLEYRHLRMRKNNKTPASKKGWRDTSKNVRNLREEEEAIQQKC